MQLTIASIDPARPIPAQFTCDGADLSPALQWSAAPAGTRSFALIVDDPDAPSGTFGHWGAYDIPASVTQLGEGAGRAGAPGFRQAVNDFGVEGYRGPCPPRGHGAHHYRFRLIALDVESLDLQSSPRIAELARAISAHVVGETTFSASYGRH